MFVLKRNQIIITALVIMVAVAGYLNYIDTGGYDPVGLALNDDGEVLALIPDSKSFTEDIVPVNLSSNEITGLVSDGLVVTVDDNPEIYTELSNETAQDSIPEALPADDPGTAVFVSATATSSSTYFISAKLEREQARAKQKDILTEMINNTNIEQTKRAECATAMLEIQKRIEKETAAEAMIEAKGFSEVYVRIDDDTVDVVVSKEVLSEAEIAQIEDIVKRKTGYTAEQIRISPMKKSN